jgi:hypothetical protein
MIRYSTAALAILLTVTAGAAWGQTKGSSDSKPPVTNNTSGMAGDKSKNAESAPRGPDTKGAVDVSPGVGTVEGADGKPPIPAGTRK